jgi:hypothetical protein
MIEVRRKSRQTGTVIVLVKAEEAGFDPAGGPWVTYCEDHGRLVNHQTRRLAERFMADPLCWCEICNGNEQAHPDDS